MARQLSFNLPVDPDYTLAGFVVAPGNAIARAMIDRWHDWPLRKLVISGPAGSGKTHLAHIWAEATRATILQASELQDTDIADLASGPVCIENVPAIAQDMAAQTAMFHLHNLLQDAGHPLLMTGIGTPNHWGLRLADLQSRVDAAGHAALDLPDDRLLEAVLHKHFQDRQLTPHPDVVPYLIRRIDRSFGTAQQVVAALDAESLATRKPITRPMATALLDSLSKDAR